MSPEVKKMSGSYFDRMQEGRERYACEDQREHLYEVAISAARRGMCNKDRLQMIVAACCYPGQGGMDVMRAPVVSHSRPFHAERRAA